MPKIAAFNLEDWQLSYLSERLPGFEIVPFDGPGGPGALAECEVLSPFLRPRVDAALLSQAPRARLVVTRSTGFDHIDRAECARRGVVVCNVPAYGENTVAEFAFALLLSLARRIHRIYARGLLGEFTTGEQRGLELGGKTLGVLGTGRIGSHVVRIGLGFEMKVLGYDVRPSAELAALPGFRYASLDKVLSTSDVLSLHLPYDERTHHLLDRAAFARMKRGALLVNTARGGLVDTEALLWALDQGILGGAALDVLEGEELVDDEMQLLATRNTSDLLKYVRARALFSRPNVIFTPHIAFNTSEAVRRILDTTAENVRAFYAGRPINVVAG